MKWVKVQTLCLEMSAKHFHNSCTKFKVLARPDDIFLKFLVKIEQNERYIFIKPGYLMHFCSQVFLMRQRNIFVIGHIKSSVTKQAKSLKIYQSKLGYYVNVFIVFKVKTVFLECGSDFWNTYKIGKKKGSKDHKVLLKPR